MTNERKIITVVAIEFWRIEIQIESKEIMPVQNANINTNLPTYVLITPAKNEASFIKLTLESVIKQTVKPIKWVIVSDGSTDGTDDIVKKYAAECNWIELVRMPERPERHFAGKVHAFNAGYARVKDSPYDIIGNLDADLSFEENYFSFLMRKFAEDPHLGVGGTPYREGSVQYDYRFSNIEHVSGACQLFRRECFESIGGYVPLEVGGIDLVAVTTARMNGWKTRTFIEKACVHHRKIGTASNQGLKVFFKSGYHDYLMGVNWVWQIFRSAYQMRNRPYIIGGCGLFAGYYWALITRTEQLVSNDFIEFRKREQMRRLREFFFKFFFPSGSRNP
jgi:poly-beta-1,6-N-acetyl-D-glucosamine synthase